VDFSAAVIQGGLQLNTSIEYLGELKFRIEFPIALDSVGSTGKGSKRFAILRKLGGVCGFIKD